jgi:hypothetical protein
MRKHAGLQIGNTGHLELNVGYSDRVTGPDPGQNPSQPGPTESLRRETKISGGYVGASSMDRCHTK